MLRPFFGQLLGHEQIRKCGRVRRARDLYRMKKLTTLLMLNNTGIQLEIDTGAELSTILFSVHREKLSKVKLEPSTVSLHQYDGTPLSVWGEIILNVQK